MSADTTSTAALHKPRKPYPRLKTTAWDMLALLGRYWLRRPLRFFLSCAIVIGMVAADIAMPMAAGAMVDRIVEAIIGEGDMSAAHFALLVFAGAGVFGFTLRWIHSRVWNGMAAANMRELLAETFERVQRFSSDWHANTFAGATVRRVTRGKWAYDAMSDIFWVHFLQLGLVVGGITLIMLLRFPIVGLLFLVTVVIYIAISTWLAIKYVRPANVKSAEADSAIGASIADSITNNAAVKAFGAEHREDGLFRGVVGRWSGLARNSWNRGQDLAAVQQLLWIALQLSTIYVLIELAKAGQASPGDVTFVLTVNFMLGGRLRQVGDHIRQLQRTTSEFADVVDFHKRPPQVRDMEGAVEVVPSGGRIEFDHVTFAYGQSAHAIYQDFSIDIHPGERIGLVGASGAGKSTFVKLIQRLYDIDSGEIRIDGQGIDKVTQASLRRAVALVPQDPLLFHRSLADNIAYARPGASLHEITEAARKASADKFIDNLEFGLDTLVGERGIKLSGGERQRVAIARAFLADAPIVIFDEATSSLDTITEKHIQDAMAELMDGRTTIIIAHRLSTVRDVDRILVFENGSIVEQGSHQTLLRNDNGIYRALHDMQADVLV
ncbi:ABC transporter ATP-binding protein [Hyphomonas atlantica corrig.]|uniref:ABC transporter ATP-binding protein n=1 Tax=Hyphomonas atlantica TaxID=1280948 RepID=UPI0023553025|nr:ABC transporter ATP-binding protein [Hyphomonas atlantica]